jgi:hypothetical protein
MRFQEVWFLWVTFYYIEFQVGLFPDVFEYLADQHLKRGDEVVAFRSLGKFSGLQTIYVLSKV